MNKSVKTFRVDEGSNVEKWFNTQKNASESVVDIINRYLSGELVPKLEAESDKELNHKIKKLKVADLTLKVWDRLRNAGYSIEQLEAFVKNGELSYPERKTFYAETPEKPKPELAKYGTTITNKPNKIQQEDGTLRCKHCNKRIEMRAFDFEQLDDYRIHVESTHGKLDNSERAELLEIYPN